MSKEITIGTTKYQTVKLDVFMQFHITRKLLPVMVAFGNFRDPAKRGDVTALLGPIAEVMATMSKDDAEFLLCACLDGVRQQVNGQWAAVKADGSKVLMDDNLSLAVVLQLVQLVLSENLGSFFAVAEQLFPGLVGMTGSNP